MSLVDLVHRVFTGPSFHVFFLVFRPGESMKSSSNGYFWHGAMRRTPGMFKTRTESSMVALKVPISTSDDWKSRRCHPVRSMYCEHGHGGHPALSVPAKP